MIVTHGNKHSKVSSITTSADESLEESIIRVMEPLGGLSRYISKDDTILLKPNFNTGDPFPASTDPDFLLAIVNLVIRYSSEIKIVESSTLRANTRNIFKKLMTDRLNKYDIPIITEKEFKYKSIDLKEIGGKYLKSVKFPKILFEPNVKIILLPCIKTHFVGEYTGALKLAVGFMERKQRMRMHISRKVPEKVAEMNLAYHPRLIIMDARKTFVTGGPASGKVEYPNKLLAGTNRTDVDIEGVKIIQSYKQKNHLLNKDPYEVRTIKRALEIGID
ncbi:MAG: DUF362 domain-containing protein [Candidatus Hodarchaeales archaeon]